MENERQIKDFMKYVPQAEEFFNVNQKGFLSTTVNTEYTVSTYDITVRFYGNIIMITTEIALSVNPDGIPGYDDMRNLLDSLNDLIKSGEFHITKDTHRLAFTVFCSMEELLRDSYDILFFGIETLKTYMNAILKVFGGTRVFYLRV